MRLTQQAIKRCMPLHPAMTLRSRQRNHVRHPKYPGPEYKQVIQQHDGAPEQLLYPKTTINALEADLRYRTNAQHVFATAHLGTHQLRIERQTRYPPTFLNSVASPEEEHIWQRARKDPSSCSLATPSRPNGEAWGCKVDIIFQKISGWRK